MRTIFITGISRGLGLELAEALSADGSTYIIGCSRRKSQRLESILCRRRNIEWHSVDLSETEALEKRLKEILEGRIIHGVINNAAILYKSLLVQADMSSFENMMRVNVIAPAIVCKTVISNFLRNGVEGSMLFYSSICAHKGFSGLTMMGSSKGAIESLSKNISAEYGKRGIRSNVISIGLLETGMSDTVNAIQHSEIVGNSSLRRVTDVRSVLELSKYLLSDNSLSVTGQVFHINCGAL